ncbi:MAG TPA: hypothetical protein VJ965_02020 [Anaerolineales bacterium]|nr:hypothetical protein [Anaerolineales bacterium]
MPKKKQALLYIVLTFLIVSFAACGLNLDKVNVKIPFVPTKTSTLIPTPLPTVTPTYPPKIEASTNQYLVEVQEDSSTIFTDLELGYQLEFSPEWLVISVDETGQDTLLENTADALSENMQQMLSAALQQGGIRMIAMDYIQVYHETGDSIANMNVIYQTDLASQTYELSFLLENNAAVLPTLIPDSDVTYQAIQTNPNGIEYAKMVVRHPASTFGTPLQQIMMMVKLDEGVLAITASVEESMYSEAEPAFLRVFNSLKWVD